MEKWDINEVSMMTNGVMSYNVANHIKELVKTGKLKAGDKLPPERELSTNLGVSRTVLREAMKLLKAIGLVEGRLGVGTFIRKPSPKILNGPLSIFIGSNPNAVEDLQECRDYLEPPIAYRAALNATAETITKLEQALKDMDDNIDNHEYFIKADIAFHSALADATKNDVLMLFINSLMHLMHEARRYALQAPGAADRAILHHRRILEAVRAGDKEKAREAMEDHMQQTKDDIKRSMNRSVHSIDPITED